MVRDLGCGLPGTAVRRRSTGRPDRRSVVAAGRAMGHCHIAADVASRAQVPVYGASAVGMVKLHQPPYRGRDTYGTACNGSAHVSMDGPQAPGRVGHVTAGQTFRVGEGTTANPPSKVQKVSQNTRIPMEIDLNMKELR